MNTMRQLLALAREARRPPGERLAAGIAHSTLEAVEQRLRQQLPATLREWLLTTNGPRIGPGGFCGFGVTLDIEGLLETRPEWRAHGWFPVASDGCGNFYVTLNASDDPPVGFVESIEPQSISYVVASSLSLFIELLLRKEGGEYLDWPFKKDSVRELDPKLLTLADKWPMPFA